MSFKKFNGKARAWTFLFGFGISGICLYLAFRKVDWPVLENQLFSIDPRSIILALVLANLHNFLLAARWYSLIKKFGNINYWSAFWSLRISFFFNASLPARLGEPFRIFYLKRFCNLSAGRALGAMGADRFLDFITLVILLYVSALVLGMRGSLPPTKTIIFAMMLSSILIFVATKLPKQSKWSLVDRILKFKIRIFEGMKSLLSWKVLYIAIPISLLGWCVEAASIVGFTYGMGESISIFKAFIVLAAITLAISIPSSPGHIGTFQIAAIAVLKYFGLSTEAAATVAILYHMSQLLPTLLIGAFGYHYQFSRKKTYRQHLNEKKAFRSELRSQQVDLNPYAAQTSLQDSQIPSRELSNL